MSSLLTTQILKFPSTAHLEDSTLGIGDTGDGLIPFDALRQEGCEVIYEEKVDGANSGFRFDKDGLPYGQSRGRYLDLSDRSNPRERDFNLFKDWLLAHQDELLERFLDRYVVYGEWAGMLHTIFYDRLPHFFIEFDIFDLETNQFLSTDERHSLCEGLPFVSAPVLYRGQPRDMAHMKSLVGTSCFRSPLIPERDSFGNCTGRMTSDWRPSLKAACDVVGDDYDARLEKLDQTDEMEGIYAKAERDGKVIARYKWVKPGFKQTINNADEHWHSRFMVPNLLDGPTDIFPPYLQQAGISERANYDPIKPWAWSPFTPGELPTEPEDILSAIRDSSPSI
ncbi:RNA ligase family protein [Thalassospira xianhensis]|uniref:RNA ligase family protein n=1 Tax=Thalassospira xianhensis TaxID=478503 RepID=UPI000DED41A0|nr:RNA ligase family protein [Thalassospira xianhensis]